MRLFGAIGIALVLLAGCAETPSKPPTSAPPVYTPRPGTLAWQADFTGPSIGIVNGCDGGVDDLDCHLPAGAMFGTFSRAGTQGMACVDPGPNACWSANGVLNFTPGSPGYPIIAAVTFPVTGTVSIEAVVSFVCDGPEMGDGAYAGPALIFSENSYRSIYWRCAGAGRGRMQPHLFASEVGEFPLSAASYPIGSAHALRIDWNMTEGSVQYYVDGGLQYVETGVKPVGPVHPALWLGQSHGTASRLNVYTAP